MIEYADMQCWEQLPEKFLQRLEELLPDDKRQAVLASFCESKPLTIRVNTLKTTVDILKENLTKLGIHYQNVSWYENALTLPTATTRELTQTTLYEDGHFYIQNLSSMVAPLALDPQPGEKVLDMAAAPGSKTTQMAMLMQNTGEIIANDKSRQRLYKLQPNLQQQGVTNAKVICRPGEILWKIYPNYFDKTLVDAPCTMEGRFDARDIATFKDWSPKKVKALSQTQRWLLRSAVTATKPGGTIVYATCTLSPEENEAVIDWLLRVEPYPLSVEKFSFSGLTIEKPFMQWKKHTFTEKINHCCRILPSQNLEGFFIAKIKKLA